MMSDDIEGFFTNVDLEAAIEAHERIIELYLTQYANKKKVNGDFKLLPETVKRFLFQ